MSKLPEMTPNDAKERAKSIRCDGDVSQPAIGTWQLPLVAGALQIAYRDGAAAERERIAGMLRGANTVCAVAAALSVAGANNPNPKKPDEQLPQVPFHEQPIGWQARCEREATAALRALADLIDATGSVPGGTGREESA